MIKPKIYKNICTIIMWYVCKFNKYSNFILKDIKIMNYYYYNVYFYAITNISMMTTFTVPDFIYFIYYHHTSMELWYGMIKTFKMITETSN